MKFCKCWAARELKYERLLHQDSIKYYEYRCVKIKILSFIQR